MRYKLLSPGILLISSQGTLAIPEDPNNRHYQEFLEWVAAGNVPEPADPPPVPSNDPSIDERLQAAETLINLLLDEEAV